MNKNTERLKQILDNYHQIADQNPDTLRNLIPSKEIWRFFVDADIQHHGRGLCFENIFCTKNFSFIYFSPINNLTYTVREYIEKVENPKQTHYLSDKRIKNLLTFYRWFMTTEEENNLTLLDILSLDKAWIPFERNEPGYLKSLVKTFDKIFKQDSSLTISFIKSLHKSAMDELVQIKGGEALTCFGGEFRYAPDIAFALLEKNCTCNGLYEWINKLEHDKAMADNSELFVSFGDRYFFYLNAKFFSEVKKLMPDELDDEMLINRFNIFSKGELSTVKIMLPLIKKLIGVEDNKLIATYLYEDILQSTTRNKYYQFQSIQPDYRASRVLSSKIQELIDRYEKQIIKSQSNLSKLTAIISFIQSCEQLHPFNDGNCRTFCMLLLNYLLIQNGFPLAILKEPNRFDLASKNELFDLVLDGMANTMHLIETQQLFDIKTDDMITFLSSKHYLSPFLTYFNEVIEIEDQARRNLHYVPTPGISV